MLQTTCAAISDIPEIEKFRYKAPGTYFKQMLIMLQLTVAQIQIQVITTSLVPICRLHKPLPFITEVGTWMSLRSISSSLFASEPELRAISITPAYLLEPVFLDELVRSVIVSLAWPSITGFFVKASSIAIELVLSTPIKNRWADVRRPVTVACMQATDSLFDSLYVFLAWVI